MKALDGVGGTLPFGNVNSNTSAFNLVCFLYWPSATILDILVGWICLLVTCLFISCCTFPKVD